MSNQVRKQQPQHDDSPDAAALGGKLLAIVERLMERMDDTGAYVVDMHARQGRTVVNIVVDRHRETGCPMMDDGE